MTWKIPKVTAVEDADKLGQRMNADVVPEVRMTLEEARRDTLSRIR